MAESKKIVVIIQCPHCQYSWEYRGIGFNIKCPKCGKYHHKSEIKEGN